MKEYKTYELRATKRPAKSTLLSTTVAIQRGTEQYYCYVSFSEKFVQAVGKKLPRGLSKQDPAHLGVLRTDKNWQVWARYNDSSAGVLLWTTKEVPTWLNFYKTKQG